MTDQRVPVGVQAGGRHGQHHVAGHHAFRTQDLVPFHNPRRGSRKVVVVGSQQSRMLRSLPAQQRATGLAACHGDPLHDGGNAFWMDLAAGDVVGHEQRFRAADDEVVDDHADQVVADGVVPVQRLGDRNLGAYAVSRGGQHGMGELRERAGVEESGEAADAAYDLRPAGLGDPLLHQLDGAITSLDVHPSRRVRRLVRLSWS